MMAKRQEALTLDLKGGGKWQTPIARRKKMPRTTVVNNDLSMNGSDNQNDFGVWNCAY